ncbi:GGDEF domain-containing protein [Nocardia stercoris]|uniref:GGDEF domain-containing protein n=1 Tax=Nocardia stercoris TaxID=2483361 RepID=A0A3M2KY84_9NOCA|nr:GGDEF domain-containing protein [Nocardia stercoris]
MKPVKIVSEWWHDPLDYRWLIRTLDARGALSPIKGVVAGGGVILAAICLLNWESATGPAVVGRLVPIVAMAASLLWAVYWWLAPWPSERVSLLLVAGSDVLITLGCLAGNDRLYGWLLAIALIVTGGYLTVFHGPRILAVHTAWSLLSVSALAWLTVDYGDGDLTLAGSAVLVMASVMVGLLPALHFAYWALRMDALTDPLTGLLNRRGLVYYVSARFRRDDRRPICLMSLDLDRFKAVNDTYGHTAGDRVLVRIAACLRSACPPGGVVARTGGEEFVVCADVWPEATVAAAERLRLAIEASSDPVTASIGVVVADPDSPRRDLEIMLRESDSAMYRGKQLGGNAVVLADRPDEV